MSTSVPQYPFDPTGVAASNLVAETQTIQSRGMFDQYYVIPRSGPFYAESVRLRLYPTGANVNNPVGGVLLNEGEHYNFGYHFAQASHTIGKPVYGAISFYDRALAGQLRMEYQTLGGEWVLNHDAMIELLANVAYNPRIATWEQVVELPHQFPVVNHDFSIDDFVGMSEVEDRLSDIENAILQKTSGGFGDHIADKSNPHEVTKTQVGLGLVDNYPTAAPAEAEAGILNNRMMTPLRTRQAIDAVAIAALNTHAANTNNPHGVTKAQVGLSSVQNYAIASQAEAEAGSSNARYMTPVRTREAIVAIVQTAFAAHAANTSNPHNVTKAQVGLGNVINIGLASDSDAISGLGDNGVITPRLLGMVLGNTFGDFSDHIVDGLNPHGVTKAQIGLGSVADYAIASQAEAEDATLDNRYMTPLATRRTINALVGEASSGHISDFGNPHQVTKVQVGLSNVENFPIATQVDAEAAIVNNRYMTPLTTKHAIGALVGEMTNDHIADKQNPHGVTKTQVGLGNVADFPVATQAEAEAAIADNRYMTPLATKQAIDALVGDTSSGHMNDFGNPHQVTKVQVGLSNVENFTVATQADAEAGIANNHYMTPLATKHAIDALVGEMTIEHIVDNLNPHGVTKAQVGLGNVLDYGVASQAEAEAAVANNRYMTPLATRQTIAALVGDSSSEHLGDFENPHQVTAAQTGAYSIAESNTLLLGKLGVSATAADSARVYGLNQPGLQAWIETLTVLNSQKLDGKSLPAITTEILSGKAADSYTLDGRTFEQVREEIVSVIVGGDAIQFNYDVPPVDYVLDDTSQPVPAVTHWLSIGKSVNSPGSYGDITLLITGGRDDTVSGQGHHSALFELSLTETAPDEGNPGNITLVVAQSRVKYLTKGDDPIVIGYVINNQGTPEAEIEIFIKTAGQRCGWTINELTNDKFAVSQFDVLLNETDLVSVEPAGILYSETIGDFSEEVASSVAHVASRSNPHVVTKAQVGLSLVSNYQDASSVEAIAGTATNRFMTPARTADAVNNVVDSLCDQLGMVIDNALINYF